jgi:hypothetical protein
MVLSWFNLAISYHPTYKWISPTLLHVHSKLPMASGTHHRAGLGTIRTRLSMNQYISVYGWHNIWCNNVQHLVEQICGWNSLKFQPWTLLAVPKKAEQRPNFIPAWLKLDEKDNKLSRRVVFSFANSCISWPYIPKSAPKLAGHNSSFVGAAPSSYTFCDLFQFEFLFTCGPHVNRCHASTSSGSIPVAHGLQELKATGHQSLELLFISLGARTPWWHWHI